MFKKSITYKNFEDVEVTRDFWFHLSKADLMGLYGEGTTLQQQIQKMIDTQDVTSILQEFRRLIKASVGIRDGDRFLRTEEAQSHLLDSPAYDVLLFELVQDAKGSAEFISKLMPSDLQKQLAKVETAADPFKEPESPGTPKDERPAYMRENRTATPDEVKKMTHSEIVAAMAWAQSHPKKSE